MHLLVLGGNSDIGYAIARQYADRYSADVTLASRNMEMLEKKAADLSIRYQVECRAKYFDAEDYATHMDFYRNLSPSPDGVVLAFGYLPKQEEAASDFKEAERTLSINYVGAVSILEIIASDLIRREKGFIVAVSSVAGERGRQNNYIYGSAKAGLTAYLSGLRQRLYRYDIPVLTVKPGFVETKMTKDIQTPGLLTMSPDLVARKTIKALRSGRSVTYITWYWWAIMKIIKAIPEFIFKRLQI